jgi:phosphonate transport system substrate-binding protein
MKTLIMSRTSTTLLTCAVTLLSLYGNPALASGKCENPNELRFSLVPVANVERDIRRHQPLFDRLEVLTGRPVVVARPSSYASVVEGLLSANIDVAKLGPAGYVQAKNGDHRITPFATQEKRDGTFQAKGPYYHAFLVTRENSRYSSIDSLKGKRLALTDPGSTSGSLLPREEFTPLIGMPLEKYFGAVIFSGSHSKSLDALLKGDVDAAFIASGQLEDALQSGKIKSSQIQTLWKSAQIPFDPFVMRGQLCEPLKTQIRQAFLDNDPSLRPLLDEIEAIRYVPIDDSHYTSIRKVMDKLLK